MTELMELDRAALLRVRFQEFGDRYIRCLDDRRFGAYAVLSNFLVAYSDYEGNTKVFAAGEYRDVIVEREGTLKFRERLVVLDSFNIQSQLIDPL